MDARSAQAEFAAALFDPAAPLPPGLTTARGVADPTRFAVYRNNVMVALVGALEQRFPVVRRLVGEDFFRILARAYIGVSKPSSPLIFEYGGDFADFVATFEAARTLPYLADVAHLEAAWTRAYHAAEAIPLELSALGAIDPDQLPVLRLVAHPSATILRSAFPAGSIWEAHQHETVSPPSRWGPETILVLRPGSRVEVHVVPSQDAAFAAALIDGLSIGDAAEAAAGEEGFDFGAAVVGLISLGAFVKIDLSPERNNR